MKRMAAALLGAWMLFGISPCMAQEIKLNLDFFKTSGQSAATAPSTKNMSGLKTRGR